MYVVYFCSNYIFDGTPPTFIINGKSPFVYSTARSTLSNIARVQYFVSNIPSKGLRILALVNMVMRKKHPLQNGLCSCVHSHCIENHIKHIFTDFLDYR